MSCLKRLTPSVTSQKTLREIANGLKKILNNRQRDVYDRESGRYRYDLALEALSKILTRLVEMETQKTIEELL